MLLGVKVPLWSNAPGVALWGMATPEVAHGPAISGAW